MTFHDQNNAVTCRTARFGSLLEFTKTKLGEISDFRRIPCLQVCPEGRLPNGNYDFKPNRCVEEKLPLGEADLCYSLPLFPPL